MHIAESREGDRNHNGGSVEFHSARPKRDNSVCKADIYSAEFVDVAHEVRFGSDGVEHLLPHEFAFTREVAGNPSQFNFLEVVFFKPCAVVNRLLLNQSKDFN